MQRGYGCAIMNPDIQQKILKFETFVNDVLKEDLAQLEQKLNAKNADLAEFFQLKSMITTLQSNGFDKSGFKTQVDIGQNFFIEAHIPDASTILLDVGLGHYVEFSLNDALVIINVRIKLLEQQIANLRKEIAKTNAHIKLILLGIRELQGFED
ncbi:Protein UXT homolog [Anthophora plagiata]